MAGGRPTKLTPELQKAICDAVAAGNYYETACGLSGIDYSTFLKWIRRGKKAKQGQFFQFVLAVRKAKTAAEAEVVSQWRKQMPENWQACRDFLARRHAERWGPKESVEVGGKKGKPLEIKQEVDLKKLSDEQLEQLESLLALASGEEGSAEQDSPGEVRTPPG